MWTTFPDLQLGVIDASKNAQKLVAVRYFSATANYATGDLVAQNGAVWSANGPVSASAFQASQWMKLATMSDLAAVSSSGAMGDNRIINGDMRIDQRNGGNILTPAPGAYTIDRWKFGATQANKLQFKQNLNAIIPATGFPYYLGVQNIGTAYTVLATDTFNLVQLIEADAVGDLGWGSANALPVTLSFWAQCSGITGTFSGSISNAAGTRSYPFSFALPTALIWVQFAITVPGDTAGAWVSSGNAASLIVRFDLGSGANWRGPANAWASANTIGVTGSANILPNTSAALYITGVKLEVGNVATPFNHPSLAKSMADCQRYYFTNIVSLLVYGGAGGAQGQTLFFPVSMRATPTMNSSGGSFQNGSTLAVDNIQPQSVRATITITAVGAAALNGWTYTASAEL